MCGVNFLRQTQRSWVSSPIAIYQLLTTIKGKGVGNKYLQICDILQEKHEFQNETLYLRHVESSKSPTTSNVRGTNFQDSNEAISILNNWFKARGCGQNVLSNEWVCDKKWIYINFCSYKGRWQMDKFTKMKIYNSFSYTEDIKYEARILEYPLHGEDFKMVMIVPNETDVMSELMETLITDGLRAAICKTQPSFIAETVAMAPDIEFTSELQAQDTQNNILTFEIGDVKIKETGISITVFTGMSSGNHESPTIRTIDGGTNNFFFALIFRDTAIITGQYKYTKETIK